MKGIADPITFEILMNRFSSITTEQGIVAAKISGSQVINECFDFNTGVMDKDGNGIFFGSFNTMVGSAMDSGCKWIINHAKDMGGINEGDIFIYNDPWVGCMHQNDVHMMAPVFFKGQIVCWQGLGMHEADLGGMVPGSMGVGFEDSRAEAILVPPVKIVDKGVYRKDIEMFITRTTRNPISIIMNIKARMGAFNFARDRIIETCKEYGIETVLAVLEGTIEYAREALKKKLREVPNGTWYQNLYWDHDGTHSTTYKGMLAMTKKDDKLTFDFRGTSSQAPGMINITRPGLSGAIICGLLPMLCFDIPRSAAALKDIMEVICDDGTIFTANYPAPTGGGPIQAGSFAANLVYSCIGKMLAGSVKFREEAQACWSANFMGMFVAGLDKDGLPMNGAIMDGSAGGGGATREHDGVDAAGLMVVLYMIMANVESNENIYPILQLWRRRAPETCGHGKYRGGTGMQTAYKAHKNPIPIFPINISAGHASPGSSNGLLGGYMPSVQMISIARNSNILELLKQGKGVRNLEEMTYERFDIGESKGFLGMFNGSDMVIQMTCGGGGYGDALERDPLLVQRDVREEIYPLDMAREIYGCVLNPNTLEIDMAATESQRQNIRKKRLEEGKLVSEVLKA